MNAKAFLEKMPAGASAMDLQIGEPEQNVGGMYTKASKIGTITATTYSVIDDIRVKKLVGWRSYAGGQRASACTRRQLMVDDSRFFRKPNRVR